MNFRVHRLECCCESFWWVSFIWICFVLVLLGFSLSLQDEPVPSAVWTQEKYWSTTTVQIQENYQDLFLACFI